MLTCFAQTSNYGRAHVAAAGKSPVWPQVAGLPACRVHTVWQRRTRQPLVGPPQSSVSCYLRMSHDETGGRNGILSLAALCSQAVGARGGFLLPSASSLAVRTDVFS